MFEEALEISLDLTIEGTKHSFLGGAVKNFDFHLTPYGCQGEIDFWVSLEDGSDDLYSSFITNKLIEVKASLKGVYNLPDSPPDPLLVQGIVYEKALEERVIKKTDDSIFYRHYRVRFADPAWVLWKQHYPCQLYVDKTLKAVLDEHKGQKITLQYDWSVLDTSHSVICLGLGTGKNEASFYDFLMWFVDKYNGVWTYNHRDNKYKLASAKAASGTATALDKLEVESWEVLFPPAKRYNVNILNSYTEKTGNKEIKNDQALSGLRRDVLMQTPVNSQFNDRVTLETNKLKNPTHKVEVEFSQFPTITYEPGGLIKFEGGLWSSNIFTNGKEYRIQEITFQGKAKEQDPMENRGMEFAGYEVEMKSTLELKGEELIPLPDFLAPEYPIYIEGKILSETKGKTQETYQIYQDQGTSQDTYKVEVPLWNNQKVIVFFTPNLFPGHFYFPYYKGERVLLALDFQKAWIKRFLDWRPGAKLPQDTQGNHLLLGWTHEGNSMSETSLKHIYKEDKPELHLKRTNAKDTETVQMKEGIMIIEVKEN